MTINEAFEQWFDEQLDIENAFTSDEPICKQAWQASAQHYEREIAELKESNELFKANMKWQANQYTQLQSSNNTLCEALEEAKNQIIEMCDTCSVPYPSASFERYWQALSATPAESLAQHDDELIEKCANVCDEYYAEGVGNTIRTLKEVK